MKIEKSP